MVFQALAAQLTLDHSGFSSGISESEKELDSFASRAQSTGRSLQRVGGLLTASLTAPITAIGATSISAASDVEEMEARFGEVFESSADDVADWADTHADEIGRSQNQLQEYAANFGSLLSAMDASEQQTAEMSKELTTLTADLASFNNQSEEQVQSNLESALSGQSRAVRKYGVDLSASRVEQELMNQGLAESADEATEAEKAQARLSLITQQTEDAQGDAARTSDSFANKMRALKADTEELRAEIGQHLLPVATSLVSKVSNAVGWFAELDESQQRVIIAAGGLLAVLGPTIGAIGTLGVAAPAVSSGLGLLAGAAGWAAGAIGGGLIPAALGANVALGPVTVPIWAIILALGALVAAIGTVTAAFWNDWGGIRSATEDGVNYVIDLVNALIEKLNAIPGVDIGTDLDEMDLEEATSNIESKVGEAGGNAKERLMDTITPDLGMDMGEDVGEGFEQGVGRDSAPDLLGEDAEEDVHGTGVDMGGEFASGFDSGAQEPTGDEKEVLESRMEAIRGRMEDAETTEEVREHREQLMQVQQELRPNMNQPEREHDPRGLLPDHEREGMDTPTETPDLPDMSGGSGGSSTMDKLLTDLPKAVRDSLSGLTVKIETGDETLDRIIEEHAELVVDEEMTRQHKRIRHS